MINKKKKKILKISLKFIFGIFIAIGLAIIGIFLFYLFDDKAHCLDIGKIYDPIQKICRDDCLTWSDKIGCIPITKENREKKARGEL